MAKLETDNQRRLGSAVSLPLLIVFGILGFGSPVFFSSVSETSLEDVGEGTKTLDEEMVQQLRQNNLGPAEMLLPLTSVDRREEYASAIAQKMTPILEMSGGGSLLDLSVYEDYFGGLDQFNKKNKRYEAFFVYNRATVSDLQKLLTEKSLNANVGFSVIPKEGRPEILESITFRATYNCAEGVKAANLEGFPSLRIAR